MHVAYNLKCCNRGNSVHTFPSQKDKSEGVGGTFNIKHKKINVFGKIRKYKNDVFQG